jgi:hypothetical protein
MRDIGDIMLHSHTTGTAIKITARIALKMPLNLSRNSINSIIIAPSNVDEDKLALRRWYTTRPTKIQLSKHNRKKTCASISGIK